MTIRNLDRVLAPRAVALIGASTRPRSIGHLMLTNMRAAGFAGTLMPVNPHGGEIDGLRVWPDIASLPENPDLAVIATPPDTVAGLIAELAQRGCAGAVVITAGFGEGGAPIGVQRRQDMLEAARPALLRIIGPNCLGLVVPGTGVNASFSHVQAKPGSIACFTQSGAVAAGLMDWAAARGVGFRTMVSLGDMVDVDFGDLLDVAASDPGTSAILLYVESIGAANPMAARKFMSAARAAARTRPVIVVKSGRHQAAAKAAASHTGALAGSDAVYDAAFRRAGLLRVAGLEQLFSAAETLAHTRPTQGAGPTQGDRTVIVTNGGGFGVLATDALLDVGGNLATLSPATRAALDRVLPATWSGANPVDMIGDADGARYRATLDVLLADPDIDIVLALNCPTGVASSAEAARGALAAASAKPAQSARLLACWLGTQDRAATGHAFSGAGIPSFESIESTVAATAQLAEFARNQRLMLRVPDAWGDETTAVDQDRVAQILLAAQAAGQSWLPGEAARDVLAAYGIPTARPQLATTPAEAARLAAVLCGKVVLKVDSQDIPHKSDIGGVVLDLAPEAVIGAAEAMLSRIATTMPRAKISGFTVEPMIRRADAIELIIGASVDPTFGPVILFGHGGVAVEAIADTALALPPLDRDMALALIARTRVANLLRGFRHHRPADHGAIARALMAVARLVLDHSDIAELDINPLLADADGVIAVDARIRLGDPARRVPSAIVPYPAELETTLVLADQTRVSLRPIRPTDATALQRMHAALAPGDIRARYHGSLRSLDAPLLTRLTQIDYDREMALIAFTPDDAVPLGVVRLHGDPERIQAEFAILVRSDWHGRGLGTAMLRRLIDVAHHRGLRRLVAAVLRDNAAMLHLARALSFRTMEQMGDAVMVALEL